MPKELPKYNTEEFIKLIPKAELNIHIEGTLEPEMMLAFAKRNKIKLPYQTLEEIHQAYQFKDLQSFLNIYYTGLQTLVKEKDFYELTLAYLEKAKAQNIRHAEIFFDAQAHTSRGIALETVLNGMNKALEEGKKQFQISSHLILCFLRDQPLEAAQKVFEEALPFKDKIIAIGLDSEEKNHPPKVFQPLFEKALEQGLLTVAQAGEDGPPEYIWQALDLLKVSRIDHGVQCVKDPDLVSHLLAIKMPLTMCPISNVKLQIIKNLREHPIKKMLNEGLCVTINSDDPAYFHAYLNENFIATNAALKFNRAEILEMARHSFMASFLDFSEKQKYIDELEKFE